MLSVKVTILVTLVGLYHDPVAGEMADRTKRQLFPSDDDTDGQCLTFLGYSGHCIPYPDCPALHVDDFLARKSLCGFTFQRIPLVCCPQPPPRNSRPLGSFLPLPRPRPQSPTRRPVRSTTQRVFRPVRYTTRPPFKPHRRPVVRPRPRPITPHPNDIPGGVSNIIPRNCGISNATRVRIVGGREANIGSWPWVALLFIDSVGSGIRSPLCGGALITSQHVITAAHCTRHDNKTLRPNAFIVRLGEHDYLDDQDGAHHVDVAVERVISHEQFNSKTYLNDVAILRLKDRVRLGNGIGTLCLPFGNLRNENLTGRNANIAGWGELYYGGPSSSSLQETRIPIQTLATCQESFKRTSIRFTDHYLCAGSLRGDKDACRGDSGGPLMVLDREGRFTIIGITSFGRKCAEPGYPGVYTRVSTYLDWITSKLV